MSATTARPRTTVAMGAAMQGVGGGLGWSLLPPLMPMMAADLEISHAMGGLVWGAAPLGIALSAPLGGAAVDRFGPRRVAGVAMLVGALACGLRAVAGDAWGLAVLMFLFGVHMGFVAPAIPKALASHVPLSHLGRANGLALLSYTLGTAATVFFAATTIVPLFGGWRPAMVAAAVAMGLVGVLWLLTVRDRSVGGGAGHGGLVDVLRLARDRQLLRVAGMHVLLFGGYLAMLGLLPRLLIDRGMAPAEVGAVVATWLVAAGVANFGGPWLSDKIGRRRPLILGGAALAGAGLGTLALVPGADPTTCLIVAAIGGGSFAPLLMTLPLELPGIGAARAGAAMGLLMLVGQIGGFVLPTVSGALAGSGGLGAVLALLAVVHLAIVLPTLGLRETGTAAGAPVTATPATAS